MKETIIRHLPAECPWRDTLHWFNTIDSTNTYAKKLAAQGAPHGTVIIAGHQSAGRGRMGRSFSSPEGKGIYLSVVLRPNCPAQDLMHLTCAAAVAMCNAVESVCGFRPGVKWINDLVAQKRKLGGILTELSIGSCENVNYAVIGIGINCSQLPHDFPEDIRDIAISLEAVTRKQIEQAALAAAMIRELWKTDAVLLERNAIMNAYRKDCITLGQDVVILTSGGNRQGVALDVDDSGALHVQLPNGSVQTVNSGEVSVRGLSGYL